MHSAGDRSQLVRGARVGALVLAAVLVASCGATSSPSNSAPVANEATRAAIEALMRQRADALTRRDLPAFQATIDQTRPALRREQTYLYQWVDDLGPPTSSSKVLSVEPYLGRYVRALAEEDWGDLSGRTFGTPIETLYGQRYFRRDGDRWLLTEPTGDETGGERTMTVEHLAIRYDAVNEDVIARIVQDLQRIRRALDALAPVPIAATLALRIYPTAESGPSRPADVGCSFGHDEVDLYPSALTFVANGSLSKDAYQFVQTCAPYWLLEQVIPGVLARLSNDWWLKGGWIDLAAEIDRAPFLRDGCAGVPVPTLDQMKSGPPRLGTLQGDKAYHRYYAYAHSMVDYLYATYGKGKFWDLMRAYKDDASATVNFPKVLNVSPERFYAEWNVWAKKKYC